MASSGDVVFGFVIGMDTICFRLDHVFAGRALKTGASPLPAIGPGWAEFKVRHDWPAVDFKFWALKAYVFAREKQ